MDAGVRRAEDGRVAACLPAEPPDMRVELPHHHSLITQHTRWPENGRGSHT